MKLPIVGVALLLLGIGASLAGCYVVDGDSRDESSQAADRNKVASVEPFHLTAAQIEQVKEAARLTRTVDEWENLCNNFEAAGWDLDAVDELEAVVAAKERVQWTYDEEERLSDAGGLDRDAVDELRAIAAANLRVLWAYRELFILLTRSIDVVAYEELSREVGPIKALPGLLKGFCR